MIQKEVDGEIVTMFNPFARPFYKNFAQAVTRISRDRDYGVYTNVYALEIINKVDLELEDVIVDLIPPNFKPFPDVQYLFNSLNRKRAEIGGASDSTAPWRLPLPICRDGSLYIIERHISQHYCKDIQRFLRELNNLPDEEKVQIKRVTIDNINIERDDLISIFKGLQPLRDDMEPDISVNPYGLKPSLRDRLEHVYANNIRNLSIGNIYIGQQFISFMCTELIPKLFTLELFNIKSSRSRKFFGVVQETLADCNDKFHLIKLRVSGMDLSKQLDGVMVLLRKSHLSLIDIDFSWCNLNF